MKLMYFQDLHLKGKNSRNRLGNYFEDCLAKIDEIIQIAKEEKCVAILDGGDIFESYNPSYSVLDALADRFEKAKIELYSLYGNHCMNAGHIENSNTGLAHLQKRSEYFRYLNHPYLNCGIQRGFSIIGYDYYYDMETDLKNNGIQIEGNKDTWKIALVHALITPTKFFDNVSHVTPEQIQTNADLVLCSHYHHPFKKVVNNTVFLNIGCVGRNNINESDIEPSVLILDTVKRDYEIIKLTSAKKANKIFDLSKYEELKVNKTNIKDFIDSLKGTNFQSFDIGQQITHLANVNNISQKVVDNILIIIEKNHE